MTVDVIYVSQTDKQYASSIILLWRYSKNVKHNTIVIPLRIMHICKII